MTLPSPLCMDPTFPVSGPLLASPQDLTFQAAPALPLQAREGGLERCFL